MRHTLCWSGPFITLFSKVRVFLHHQVDVVARGCTNFQDIVIFHLGLCGPPNSRYVLTKCYVNNYIGDKFLSLFENLAILRSLKPFFLSYHQVYISFYLMEATTLRYFREIAYFTPSSCIFMPFGFPYFISLFLTCED